MSNLQWFYSDSAGQQQGPVAGDVIAGHVGSGALDPSSLVWREGLAAWVPLTQVSGELGLAPPVMPTPTPPPPPRMSTPPLPAPPRMSTPPPPAMQSPQSPPAAPSVSSPLPSVGYQQATGPLDESAAAVFIGSNQDFYQRKWKAAEASGSKVSWNWPALFLGPSWFIYRKMYKNAFILLGLYFFLGIVEQVLPEGLVLLVQLGLSVSVGLFANHLYRLYVGEKVELVKRTTLAEGREPELLRQGGTNLGGAIAFLVVMVVIVFLLSDL